MENRFPKNVRQIGNVSDSPKIYVEDYVDTFLNQLCDKNEEIATGAFLIGETVRRDDGDHIYISGAVKIAELLSEGSEVVISSASWEQAREECKEFFGGKIIGWYINIPGAPPNLTNSLIRLHEEYFVKPGTVFILKTSFEKDEIFYTYKFRELMEMQGHYVYYERNPQMQNYMLSIRKQIGVTPSENVEDTAAKNFRNIVREQMEQQEQRNNSKGLYIASVFLVVLVAVMGTTIFNNYGKMKDVEDSVAHIKEEVLSELETKEQEVSSPEVQAVMEEEPENEEKKESVSTVQEMSEDIYIVEKGDTLAKISKKVYGDTTHVEAICKMNGLSDGNLIFIGQKLLLP